MSWTRRRLLLGLGGVSAAACGPFKGNEHQPPETPDTIAVRLPPMVKHEFGEDARLYFVENRSLPLVSIGVTIRAGFFDDPPGQEGLAAIASSLLLEGREGEDGASLTRRYEQRLGTVPQARFWSSSFGLRCTVHRDDAATALNMMVDGIRHIDRSAEAFEQLRRRRLERLSNVRGLPDALASYAMVLASVRAEPATVATSFGSSQSLGRLEHEQLLRWLDGHVRPDQLSFSFAGDLSFEEARRWVVEAAGDWRTPGYATPRADPWDRARTLHRAVFVPVPGIAQPILSYGAPAGDYATSDELGLAIADFIVAGRVGYELRTQQRASYSLSLSKLSTRAGPIQGRWTPLAPDDVGPAVDFITELFADMEDNPSWVRGMSHRALPEVRLQDYVKMMTKFEGPESTLSQLLRMANADLPAGAAYRRVEDLDKLTGDELASLILEAYQPERLRLSLVADPATLDEMRGRISSVPVIEREPGELLGL